MKGIILLLFIAAGLLFSIIRLPYHFYDTFMSDGIHGKYMKEDVPLSRLLHIKKFDLSSGDSLTGSQSLWRQVKLESFEFQYPFAHPSLAVMPHPYNISGKKMTGFEYLDASDKQVVSMFLMSKKLLNLSTPPELLFRLPLIKKFILKKGRRQIWKDILELNLNIYKGLGFISFLKQSPLDLAYAIYIYKMRKRIFPVKANEVMEVSPYHYLFKTNLETDQDMTTYIGMVINNGYMYRYRAVVHDYQQIGKIAFNRFLQTVRISPSAGDTDALKMYGDFRAINFQRKKTMAAVFLLYAGWSHEKGNENYMRELIQFAERGDNNEKYLQRVYSFSLETWGSSLSTKNKYLEESIQRQIDRGAELEKQVEEKNLEMLEDTEVEFASEEERINYFLNRAKTGDKKKRKSGIVIEN
jgi:hypothetical protein